MTCALVLRMLLVVLMDVCTVLGSLINKSADDVAPQSGSLWPGPRQLTQSAVNNSKTTGTWHTLKDVAGNPAMTNISELPDTAIGRRAEGTLRAMTDAAADTGLTHAVLGSMFRKRMASYRKTKTHCDILTNEPLACTKRRVAPWASHDLRAALPDFAKLYKGRPNQRNQGGVRLNHAFSLWFSLKQIRPKYVIENGVFLGQSTWLIRQALGLEARIFCLDPSPESQLTYRDSSHTTRYFMGSKFKDFGDVHWGELIPAEDRGRVFVILDDHQSSVKRVKQMLQHGFVHLWYDDNWINGDCYSFNIVCSRLPDLASHSGKILYQDNFNKIRKLIDVKEHQRNVDWLNGHLDVYFEFPAVWDPCLAHHRRESILGNASELVQLGLPDINASFKEYVHLYPPYAKLK